MRIEELTGVARNVLRPDIYPPEREQKLGLQPLTAFSTEHQRR
jgi:hypothetical protein